MTALLLSDLESLSGTTKAALKKAKFVYASELVLAFPLDVAKQLRLSLSDTQKIIEDVCKELTPVPRNLEEYMPEKQSKFTTGDAVLDTMLGGGIQTGMIWELVGESASGKTQLALQLSLLVQVPTNLGGLSGSACYLTSSAKLQTKRLTQIIFEHPLLSTDVCGLSDIHTNMVPTVQILLHTLEVKLPLLVQTLQSSPEKKKIKLLIIDSVAALFHSADKPSSQILFERSKYLAEISNLLHSIATSHGIAVIVLNEVTDVFYHTAQPTDTSSEDVLYHNQAKWFTRAHTISGEYKKDAGLGLVWANQINVRVMLSRTRRRMHVGDDQHSHSAKRRRISDANASGHSPYTPSDRVSDGHATLVRQLSVVFSSVSEPASVDFIVTSGGLSVVKDDISGMFEVSSLDREESKATEHAVLGIESDSVDYLDHAHCNPTIVDQDPADGFHWDDLEDIHEDLSSETDVQSSDQINTRCHES